MTEDQNVVENPQNTSGLSVMGDLENAAVNALNIDTDSEMSDILDEADQIQINDLKQQIEKAKAETEKAKATVNTLREWFSGVRGVI